MSTISPSTSRASHATLPMPRDPGEQRQLLLACWREDPALFCQQILGFSLTPWQVRIFQRLTHRLRTGTGGTLKVPTGHGVGKSRLAGAAIVWLCVCWGPVTVLTTAPTMRQVTKILWREVRSLIIGARIPCGIEPLQVEWNPCDGVMALGLSTNEPSRFQGFHAPLVVAIVDEAAGVDEPIWDAIRGVTTGARDLVLALGNPTDPESVFCRDLGRAPAGTEVVRVSSEEAADWNALQGEPIAGIVSRAWIEARRAEWGEDSPAFLSRVLGLVPAEASDALFRLAWVESAMRRWEDAVWECEQAKCPLTDRAAHETVLGLDVARHGGDRIAWAVRQDADVVHLEWWDFCDDLTKIVDHTKALAGRWAAKGVVVDATGIGWGVVDLLKRQRVHVLAVDFGASATREADFANRRSELWWGLREWLRLGHGALPALDAILAEPTPLYRWDGKPQRLTLESKEAMRTRLRQSHRAKSPDLWDAIALALVPWAGQMPEGVPKGAFKVRGTTLGLDVA